MYMLTHKHTQNYIVQMHSSTEFRSNRKWLGKQVGNFFSGSAVICYENHDQMNIITWYYLRPQNSHYPKFTNGTDAVPNKYQLYGVKPTMCIWTKRQIK